MADKVQALSLSLHRLGYPVAVPSDLLQRPNFEFVSDCFAWLCQRVDPDVKAPRDYASEQKRATFLASLGSQLFAKARLKVDLRSLYRAGGSAATELRAMATVLLEAGAGNDADKAATTSVAYRVATLQERKLQDKAALQELATGVAASGQRLLGSLALAPSITHQLDTALALGTDGANLKTQATAAMAAAQQQVTALKKAVAELNQEQQTLEAKVEKRHTELDRMERRLDSLHAIKPVQSEEVDRLEAELAELYRDYLQKFRNLEYLEGQLDRHNAQQEAKAEEADKAMRKIQRQMREEEARVLQGGDQNGDPNNPFVLGLAASSEDSEADFAAFERKMLPRLGAGQPSPGQGVLSDHLLLVPDDSGVSNASQASPGRQGSARISGGGAGGALPGRPSGGFGSAGGPGGATGSLRPSSAGSGKRPSSAAFRRAGSGGIAGGAGSAADVLVVSDRSSLPLPGDNDF